MKTVLTFAGRQYLMAEGTNITQLVKTLAGLKELHHGYDDKTHEEFFWPFPSKPNISIVLVAPEQIHKSRPSRP